MWRKNKSPRAHRRTGLRYSVPPQERKLPAVMAAMMMVMMAMMPMTVSKGDVEAEMWARIIRVRNNDRRMINNRCRTINYRCGLINDWLLNDDLLSGLGINNGLLRMLNDNLLHRLMNDHRRGLRDDDRRGIHVNWRWGVDDRLRLKSPG